MAWKFRGDLPLSVQIVDILRRDVLKGVYPPGDPFPTVRSLAEEAAVNPNTMQKALCLLEEEGLLVCTSTAGRRVIDDPEVIARARETERERGIKRLIEDARQMGISKSELIRGIEEAFGDG